MGPVTIQICLIKTLLHCCVQKADDDLVVNDERRLLVSNLVEEMSPVFTKRHKLKQPTC